MVTFAGQGENHLADATQPVKTGPHLLFRRDEGRSHVQLAAAASVCGAAVTWACAYVLRRQQQLVADLRAAQGALAESAVAEERARIAREVHDVVAHTLTVTLLHVSAARLAVQDRPDEAVVALAEAERLGRRSLADVRRAVGLLGPATADGDAPPLPSADDVVALTAEYRAAGMVVTAEVAGDAGALSAATSLALYRIAEESLANAARHAPGAAVEVVLRIDATEATLRVANRAPAVPTAPPPPGRGGLGLRGISQRTELIGGRLSVGPTDSGWVVEVEVPLPTEGDGDGIGS